MSVTPTRGRKYKETVLFNLSSEADAVRVETGDLVGLVVTFNTSVRCRDRAKVNILEAGDANVVYLARPATKSDLEGVNVTGFGCDDPSPDDPEITKHTFTGTGRRRTPRTGTRADSDDTRTATIQRSKSEDGSRHGANQRRGNTQFGGYHGAPLISAVVGNATHIHCPLLCA